MVAIGLQKLTVLGLDTSRDRAIKKALIKAGLQDTNTRPTSVLSQIREEPQLEQGLMKIIHDWVVVLRGENIAVTTSSYYEPEE